MQNKNLKYQSVCHIFNLSVSHHKSSQSLTSSPLRIWSWSGSSSAFLVWRFHIEVLITVPQENFNKSHIVLQDGSISFSDAPYWPPL